MVQAPAAAAAPTKRAKTIGTLAVVAGIVAAVVGLVGVLTSGRGMDPIDLLLFAGGMLVSVLGFRVMRKSRAS
jgi:flagellar motor component MotA